MKKRLLATLMALMICVIALITSDIGVYAADSIEDVEISEIWTENALIGYTQTQTRGVYLAEGVSIINDAGSGKIGWGGVTTAATKCKVGIISIVEKKVNGSWTRVTSSTTTNASAYTAVVSKTLSVGSGYQYRVRSTHYAGTDTSSSYTGTLWM